MAGWLFFCYHLNASLLFLKRVFITKKNKEKRVKEAIFFNVKPIEPKNNSYALRKV